MKKEKKKQSKRVCYCEKTKLRCIVPHVSGTLLNN